MAMYAIYLCNRRYDGLAQRIGDRRFIPDIRHLFLREGCPDDITGKDPRRRFFYRQNALP